MARAPQPVPGDPSRLRVLMGTPVNASPYRDNWKTEVDHCRRLRAAGFHVEKFCLTLNPPGPCLSFPEMDRRWRSGDCELLDMYARLEEQLADFDVLLNESGINLHPDFVARLPAFTVFQCCDDPESSDILSRPVAAAYDLCLVQNIAEVDTYRSWGVREARWIPLGLRAWMCDLSLTHDEILSGERDIDLIFLGDRLTPWRKARMDALGAAFPEAHFYGHGWPRGFLPEEQQIAMLRRAKIGPNLHNSTGPINFRTYYLPANGVMQVCDNRSHLGRIYELGREVVGFDTVAECIDLCRYYLAHDEERRRIAAAGWKRAMTDYAEAPVFRRTLEIVAECMARRAAPPRAAGERIAVRQARRARLRRLARALKPRVPWRLRQAFRRLRFGLGGAGPAPSNG